jgi:protein tyrosine phosphatase
VYILAATINQQRTPSTITEQVLMGSKHAVDNTRELRRLGVTHVVSVGVFVEPEEGIEYHPIAVADFPTEDIMIHFQPALEFMHRCVASGGTVLVHCAAGVSRSAAIVIAYCMWDMNMSYEEAYRFVSSRRWDSTYT